MARTVADHIDLLRELAARHVLRMERRGPGRINPHALGHYNDAIDDVKNDVADILGESSPEAMERLKDALSDSFIHSGRSSFALPFVTAVARLVDDQTGTPRSAGTKIAPLVIRRQNIPESHVRPDNPFLRTIEDEEGDEITIRLARRVARRHLGSKGA